MGTMHEEARMRRQRIVAMGPDLPTRQEVADAIGSTLKTVTSDIQLLIRTGKIKSAKTAARKYMDAALIKAIREDYLAGEFRDDIAAKHGIFPERVSQVCRGLQSPKKCCHRKFDANPSHTTNTANFISTTYAATEERAREIQASHLAGAERHAAAYRARASA